MPNSEQVMRKSMLRIFFVALTGSSSPMNTLMFGKHWPEHQSQMSLQESSPARSGVSFDEDSTTLDQAFIKAHAEKNNDAIVRLPTKAANQAGTTDATYFFLSQAYICALGQNHLNKQALYRRLTALGRI